MKILMGWSIPKCLGTSEAIANAIRPRSHGFTRNARRHRRSATRPRSKNAAGIRADDQACGRVGGPRGAAASQTRVGGVRRVGRTAGILTSSTRSNGGQNEAVRVGLCPSRPQ
jgi:hypothetical protein